MFLSMLGDFKVFGWVESCNTKYKASKTVIFQLPMYTLLQNTLSSTHQENYTSQRPPT